MKLPKSLTKVTGFSKLVTLFLVIAFVFVAFLGGMMWDRQFSQVAQITPTPTPIQQVQISCNRDSDCILSDLSENTTLCCPNTACTNLERGSVMAVNVTWLSTYKTSICAQRACPMIFAVCTKQLLEKNSHFTAVCVRSTCQKVSK